MSAYLIVQMMVSDSDQWRRYGEAVVPVIEAFGGRLRVLNGAQVLEGEHDGRGLVIFEFPSMQAIHSFWDSPEYKPVKAIRESAAVVDIWAVPSV